MKGEIHMFKVERINDYEFIVTAEGVEAAVKYYSGWDHKVTGKGSRKVKDEIIKAVETFKRDEYKMMVEAAKKEVENFRKTLKNIDDFSLYMVTVHEESHDHGLIKYNKLMTGFELQDKYTPAIAAEKYEIKNTDFYSIGNSSHYKRLALADERLIPINYSIYVTGLTLKEMLVNGFQGDVHIANDVEVRMIMHCGSKNPTTFSILDFADKSEEKEVSRQEIAQRVVKELQRATNSPEIVEHMEAVGVTEEGQPIKRAWFASKPCSFKDITERYCASYDRYAVVKTFTLSKDEFNLFKESLNMEILNTDFRGGSTSTYDMPAEFDNMGFYEIPEDEQAKHIMQSYMICAEVYCNEYDYSLIIDPEGYDYARYVAIVGNYNPEPEKQGNKEEENTIDIEYVDATENTEALVMSASDFQTVSNTDVPVISFNEEKNGIELKYEGKPSQSVIDDMKAHGFRWSKFNRVWWSKQTEKSMSYVNSLQASESVEHEEVEIIAAQEVMERGDNVNTVKESPVFSYGLNWNVSVDYPSKLIESLQKFGKVATDSERSFLFTYNNEMYLINDNGGEFNVLVNDEHFTNIPYTSYSIPLNPETVTYRIMQVVQGLPVDYDYKVKSDNVVNLNDYKETKEESELMQEKENTVTNNGNSNDFTFEDILGKFDDIEIENNSRISSEDKEYCEKQQEKYSASVKMYQNMLQTVTTYKEQFVQKDNQFWDTGFMDWRDINNLKERIEKMRDHLVYNICDHFSEKYNVTIDTKFKTKYDGNITYDNILDEIFLQLDGFNFEEKAIQEIKDKCKNAVRHDKITVKNSKLIIDGSFSYIDSIWKQHKLRGDYDKIFNALTYYDNGSTKGNKELIERYYGYENERKERNYEKYEPYSLTKARSIKFLKNGKLEIEFVDFTTAQKFAIEYCGYTGNGNKNAM